MGQTKIFECAASSPVRVLSSPQQQIIKHVERERPPPPLTLDVFALKNALDSLRNQSSKTADELKKNILYRRAELLLLSTAQFPSFTPLLSSDPFLASLLNNTPSSNKTPPSDPPSPPPSSLSLLHSIMSLLNTFTSTFTQNEAWQFFETKCFESTLNVLSSLESISCSLPDALEADVENWKEALKNEARPSQGDYWASGTGYGTDNDGSSWTRSTSLLEKEAKDRVIASLLTVISHFVGLVSCSQDPRIPTVTKMLQSSALLPYLSSTLPGIFEAEAEPSLQRALLCLVTSLAKPPFFESLLCLPSFLPRVRELDLIAGKVLVGATKLDEGTQDPENDETEEDGEIELALSFREVFSFFRHDSTFLIQSNASNIPRNESNSNENEEGGHKGEGEDVLEDQPPPLISYEKVFLDEDLVFGESDILSLPSFCYKEQTKEAAPFSKSGMKRLLKEQASFSSILPLHQSSSVFVRVDSSRPSVLQALITGPEGTPYQNGCFLFDVFCKNYPQSPPLVNLATTGGGVVRFNPNLYECGKVCLSLLGTWDGAAGETWDPKMSTLLQLFVSIQSLIFVEEPYYNEPGYEEEMADGYSQGESNNYSREIRKQTLKWAVVDMIENPPKGFEEVVKKHFEIKKKEVEEQAKKWCVNEKSQENEENVKKALSLL